VTCHGNPARTTWMKPSLDQPANTFPDWLPKLADREIDVAFTGCVDINIIRSSQRNTGRYSRIARDA